MTRTDNLHLKKPGADDFYNVDDFNENFDAIDAAISEKADSTHTHTKSEITDFPESMPASGGNADTFGGLNTGYFYIHRGDVPDNDCDNARGMGTYNAVPETVNTPFSSYWHIIVEYASNGSWIKQTATQCDKTNPVAYYRVFINDGWGNWIKVNDGGNADTVDGLHVENFLQSVTTVALTHSINESFAGTYSVEQIYTPDFPTGFGTYGILDARIYGTVQCQTLWFDTGVIINRTRIVGATDWSTWKKVNDGGNADKLDGFHADDFFINNKPHITSVTTTESTIHVKWLPVNGATKYAVSIYNGGTGYTTYSLDITDTEYTITGLTVGTEYYILVQAYINDAWTYISAADHIIARTNAFSSGTATATKENCPIGAWYGQYEEV